MTLGAFCSAAIRAPALSSRHSTGLVPEGLRPDDLDPAGGLVTVDLLHIELAHEGDRLVGDDLAGDHDREARWVRNDKVRRDQRRSLLEPLVHLRAVQFYVIAARFVIRLEERLPHVPFARAALGLIPEGFLE